MHDEPDYLIPDTLAREEVGNITKMTAWRWDHSAEMMELGWPPKIQIGARNYRSRRGLEKFKAALMRRAIKDRQRALRSRAESAETTREQA